MSNERKSRELAPKTDKNKSRTSQRSALADQIALLVVRRRRMPAAGRRCGCESSPETRREGKNGGE